MQVTNSEDQTQIAGTEDGSANQTNRDRVRSLLLDRLGFRFPRGFDAEAGKKALNKICDELSYLTDDSLSAMYAMLRTKGEGSARNMWPDLATFIGFAEVVQRRPIEDLPALCTWFGSVEGPRAEQQGILVETLQYISDRKMPPVTDGARKQVAAKAAANKRRLQIIEERRAADWSVDPNELAFERWYRGELERCIEIMHRERSKRGHAVDGVQA